MEKILFIKQSLKKKKIIHPADKTSSFPNPQTQMLNSLFPTLSQQPNRKNKKFQNFHEPRSTSQSPNPNTGNQKHKHKNKTIINNYTFCLTMGLLWSRRLSINPETSLTILTCDDLRSSQISSSLYTGVTLSSSEVAPSIILDLQYDSTALLLESISSTTLNSHKNTLS